MRVIDRYISASIFRIFTSTLLVFCLLYVLIDIASNLTELIDRKVPLRVLVEYYLSFFPIIISQTASVACLIAALLTFSQLNNNNEIISLRSCGLDFWRMTRPTICFGLVVSVFIFWVNERFVPRAMMNAEQIRNENIILRADTERKKKAKIRHLTFYGLKNRLFFIDSFDPNNFELEGITILGHDNEQNVIEKIVALKGQWTGIAWKFFQCQTATLNPSSPTANPEQINYYENRLMDIKETPQDFLKQRLNVTSMNIRQLHDYIKRFCHSGATKALNNLRVDLHQKIAYPVGNLVILLVGLPWAMITGRRKAMTFTSLGIAMAVGFFYYVCNAVGLALGKGGLFPPLLAAWIAPLLFFALAMYLIGKKF